MKIKILLSLFLFISLSSVNSYASEDLSTFTKVGKLIDRLLNGEWDQKDEKNTREIFSRHNFITCHCFKTFSDRQKGFLV